MLVFTAILIGIVLLDLAAVVGGVDSRDGRDWMAR